MFALTVNSGTVRTGPTQRPGMITGRATEDAVVWFEPADAIVMEDGNYS